MNLVELDTPHLAALQTFFDGLPERDLTFVREDVRDPDVLHSWVRTPRGGRRWIALDGDEVIGFVALLPLVGWSNHVGELRLVVAASRRGQGVGTRLAQRALHTAPSMGLVKVVVEVVAEQEGTIAMFTALGFDGEALLRDHIRDRTGRLQDLVVLAHMVDETWSAMAVSGVEEAVTAQR